MQHSLATESETQLKPAWKNNPPNIRVRCPGLECIRHTAGRSQQLSAGITMASGAARNGRASPPHTPQPDHTFRGKFFAVLLAQRVPTRAAKSSGEAGPHWHLSAPKCPARRVEWITQLPNYISASAPRFLLRARFIPTHDMHISARGPAHIDIQESQRRL
jgi:hypothetical protein